MKLLLRYIKMHQDCNDKTKLTSVRNNLVYNSDGLIEDCYDGKQLSWTSICRFIREDEIEYFVVVATTVSYNLYAYCLNNPVNNSDSGNLTIPNGANL